MNYLWSPWRMSYIQSPKPQNGCIFCRALEEADDQKNLILMRGERNFVILNRYPYTSGHIMIVPMVHLPNLADLDSSTRAELMELAAQFVQVIEDAYHPQGFNVGINIGEAAGAGVSDHVHMHIVPRWLGDTNFMSTLGMTRVLPESLEDTFNRLRESWENLTK